jgi:hypothetical protein
MGRRRWYALLFEVVNMNHESINHALKSLDQVYADLINDGLPVDHEIFTMIDNLQYEIQGLKE